MTIAELLEKCKEYREHYDKEMDSFRDSDAYRAEGAYEAYDFIISQLEQCM